MTFQFNGRWAATDMRDHQRRRPRARTDPLLVAPFGRNSSDVPANSPHTAASAINSLSSAKRDGTGVPSASLWVSEVVVEKPNAPGREAVAEQAAHLRQLFEWRLARWPRSPMTSAADRRVSDHEAGVDGERAVELVEVVGGAPPVPRHALAKRLAAACPRPWRASA